ncbi:MAG: SdrD B-like domain-containing protein, partial [Bacteroidota bacterium]
PNDGTQTFSGQPNSLVNLDFTLNEIPLNDCTTSSGYVYEDVNSNGIKDDGEPGIDNVIILARNTGQTTYTDPNGYYEFQFSMDMTEELEYIEDAQQTCDGIYVQTIPSVGEPISIQTGMDNQEVNFSVERQGNSGGLPCYDHQLVSYCIFQGVQPGKTFTTYLDTRTIGFNANPSEIRMNFDPSLELLSVDVPPDEVGDDYFIIRFGENEAPPSYCYQIRWRLSDTVEVGTLLNWNATFTSTDYIEPTPNNNFITRDELVVGSSRNNTSVVMESRNPNGAMPELLDSVTTQLSYVVFFENNTLDSISDITIIDTLPDAIDRFTVARPFSSHPHDFKILDNNVMIWTFKDVGIPSSLVNVGASFGFVQFNAFLKEDALPGSTFTNKATVIFNNSVMQSSNEVTHRIPMTSAVGNL